MTFVLLNDIEGADAPSPVIYQHASLALPLSRAIPFSLILRYAL